MVSVMPEPREIYPYQSFDASFRSRGQGDFRPEVIETADVDELTEDGYGGAPYPQATDLPLHPSLDAEDLNDTSAGESFVSVVTARDLESIAGATELATRLTMVEIPDQPDDVGETGPETTQEPAQDAAVAPNAYVSVPESPEFGSEAQSVSVFDADAAALADLL